MTTTEMTTTEMTTTELTTTEMTTTEMTTTEMTTTEVGEILVRIDPAENWYASLSRAAVEAEQCGLGLRLVFTAAPQEDPSRADESRGAATGRPQ
ncbi:hypothetical protein ACWGDE_22730 [Streptomyces sp. NPDC054956]